MRPCFRSTFPRGAAAAFALVVAATAAGCGSMTRSEWAAVREITPRSLARVAAEDPAIAADPHGRIALTWVTRGPGGRDAWIAVSHDSGGTFTAPVRINPDSGRVVSFGEGRPLAVFGPRGELAIAWSQRRADSSGAVDLLVRASADGGTTLGPVVRVNDDAAAPAPSGGPRRPAVNPSAFHGFAALTFLPDGALFAAWLDERRMAPTGLEPPTMTLFHALSLDGGLTWSPNAALTDSACPCCRPAVVAGPAGQLALAYRSGAGNLRDPAFAFSPDGGRSFALDTIVHRDRWYLEACPDQGPALTWDRDGGGHYAWYTGAGSPGVYVLPWRSDRGAGGMRRALDDSLTAVRHPRAAPLGTSTLLGVEARPLTDSTRTVFAIRLLRPDGTLAPWMFLGADATSGWLAGASPGTAYACWIERDGAAGRVRASRIAGRRAG